MTELKENFCGTCLAVPLSAVGASIASRSSSNINYTKQKRIELAINLFVTIAAFIIGVYWSFFKGCNSCTL